MWLEDPITQLEKAAHAAWPGVLEEAQLPMVGWSYVLLSKHEEKDRARISYLVEHPNHGLFKYRLQLRPRAQAAFAAHYLRLGKSISRLSTHRAPISDQAHVLGYRQSSQPNHLCGGSTLF
jgi:hypothetical protein